MSSEGKFAKNCLVVDPGHYAQLTNWFLSEPHSLRNEALPSRYVQWLP